MLKKNEFLATYNLTDRDLEAANLSWNELERIGTEFEIIRPGAQEHRQKFCQ